MLRCISLFDRIRFSKLLNQTADRILRETLTKNDKNLKWLITTQVGQSVLDHSSIINLSDIELSDLEKDILCRGLNFGVLPPRSATSFETIAAEFELCWQQLARLDCASDERRAECKASLVNFAHQYSSAKVDRTGYLFDGRHMMAIRDMRRNHDIIIT